MPRESDARSSFERLDRVCTLRDHDRMPKERGSTPWKSQQVRAAIIAGVATVLVALIGLVGVVVTNDGADNEAPEPTILIHEATFAPRGVEVEVNVRGTVRDFPPADRLYAIAKPTSTAEPAMWWVSEETSPNLAGEWAARILAQSGPGDELTVLAVRVPANVYEAVQGILPGLPDRELTDAEILERLGRLGPEPDWVLDSSDPYTTTTTK